MARLDLTALEDIDGFRAAALVDCDSGLSLATIGEGLNLELAAAGNTEVLRAKQRTLTTLNLDETIEDILISLSKSHHIIRPLDRNENLFLYLVLERQRSNLALARHQLRAFEKELDFS
ncbi:roadblock/LC7 domain-containing protein [Suttonella sp. R2A3]|uniref:roadblock/LC7 domain-containing protein n=1 Tax=Suttonella sp. R2A3 TaxID=2908648 RepID=UPI001F35A293|nr:roadblock/LC7 domain-containing protein [Suttonella sp. R2A3]UJF24927.1 roadblock/LC7 domain-containing protein [Suttonella sp. R2A3]